MSLSGEDIDALTGAAYAKGFAAGKVEMHNEMTTGGATASDVLVKAVETASKAVLAEALKYVPDATKMVLKALMGLL